MRTRRGSGTPRSDDARSRWSGGEAGRRRHPGRHLLWALPLALVVALPTLLVAGFAMCGISGCSGGGFGPTDTARGLVIPLLALGGVALAVPLLLVPWQPRRRTRLCVAVGTGLLWTASNAMFLYAQV